MTSPITTHVLDTARGCAATGIAVTLESAGADGEWSLLADGITNQDGRVADLLDAESIHQGVYRISFQTADYYHSQGIRGFYPVVRIEFEITNPEEHYHVPLLLSPYGYSTYRGS